MQRDDENRDEREMLDEARAESSTLRRETHYVSADRHRVALVAALCTLVGVGSGFAMSQLASANNNHCHRHELASAPNFQVQPEAPESYTWLGVSFGRTCSGAMVVEALPGSPAEAAGIEAGDTIVSVDGTPVVDGNSLTYEVRRHRPGEEVTVTLINPEGEVRERGVTLGRIDAIDFYEQSRRRRRARRR